MNISSHKDLDVFKNSLLIVKSIYSLTDSLPEEEKFGLASQMRRSAVSVPCNISEGAARSSTKEFIRFLDISSSSLSELETLIYLLKELEYTEVPTEMIENIDITRKKLIKLIYSLKQKL